MCADGFGLVIEILEIWGRVIYRWKYILKTFSNNILHAPFVFNAVVEQKRKICSCLAIANQVCQKNRIQFRLRFFWA